MKSKDFLSISDLTPERLRTLITRAVNMKAEGWNSLLSEKVLVLMFEKPSTRTRVSFEVAMRQLGGQCLYLSPDEVGLGKRESIPDVARVLSRYADVIASRTFSHETLEIMANNADIPVINALSDLEHPCQALADIMTIYEHKQTLQGLTLAYIGDGNNTANSLLLAASLCGINFHIASPAGYETKENIWRTAQSYASVSGSEVICVKEPRAAVTNADIVYTDVWVSMGQESESKQRRKAFSSFQVDSALLSQARKDAILMHPLPAHHGEEVAENIIYCQQSVIFDQAENRLHAQKALLADILGGSEILEPGYR
ncbi:MAG: ornithine carbamoyltransferase [Chloroflexi bacterium RBG_13_52_12]|nr:MAG: ornithine carbamoyltransferase [Chloroflexi bacterium RBG_13_52_12]